MRSVISAFSTLCINAHPTFFASQPASFNQVHQTLVQLAIMQGNPITMGEYGNQPKHLVTHQPPPPHTHTFTQYTLVGTQGTHAVTLASPTPTQTRAHTHVHFITQSSRTFKTFWTPLYAVGDFRV